ncbi:hypothetical protein T4A_139, partial [Trichinella pseudospiralis]
KVVFTSSQRRHSDVFWTSSWRRTPARRTRRYWHNLRRSITIDEETYELKLPRQNLRHISASWHWNASGGIALRREEIIQRTVGRDSWHLLHHVVYQGEGLLKKCCVVVDGFTQHCFTDQAVGARAKLPEGSYGDAAMFSCCLQADGAVHKRSACREDDRDSCQFLWRINEGDKAVMCSD